VELSADLKRAVLTAQKNEITEHFIYKKLAAIIKDEHNSKLLAQISQDELRHHGFWQKITNRNIVWVIVNDDDNYDPFNSSASEAFCNRSSRNA